MADHITAYTMNNAYHPYWATDQSDRDLAHPRPPAQTLPLCGQFMPLQYVHGVHQQYYPQSMYFPITGYAAPEYQHALPTHVRPIQQFQAGDRLVNGIFVPNALDIARGKVNQAVFEARFRHEYTDNTTKAMRVRALFDKYFGTNPKKLLAWQDMCFFCGASITDMPATIRACKVFLRSKHVNIFDFVTVVDEFMSSQIVDRVYEMKLPTFSTARKLEQYTREKSLICPARIGKGNDLFRFMLAKWF